MREGALVDLCGSETAFRARFAAGFDAAALAALGFRATDVDGVFRIDAPSPRALNDALDAARRAGALLLELARDLRDLEDVLAEALTGPPRPAGAAGGPTPARAEGA